MARKRKMAPRKTRRASAPKRKRSAGRRSVRKAGFDISITNMALLAGGALVANAYVDKLPIADAKIRYAVGAAGSFFAAQAMPNLAPAFLGFGTISAAKALQSFFPDLAKIGNGSTGNTQITLPDGSAVPNRTIGRLTNQEEKQIRAAVMRQAQPYAPSNAVIVGTGAGVIVGNGTYSPSFT
jgi:hypothetical protein